MVDNSSLLNLTAPKLRAFLESIDKSKVKLWLFTNAYKTHASYVTPALSILFLIYILLTFLCINSRVVKALGVEDLFEGKFGLLSR